MVDYILIGGIIIALFFIFLWIALKIPTPDPFKPKPEQIRRSKDRFKIKGLVTRFNREFEAEKNRLEKQSLSAEEIEMELIHKFKTRLKKIVVMINNETLRSKTRERVLLGEEFKNFEKFRKMIE